MKLPNYNQSFNLGITYKKSQWNIINITNYNYYNEYNKNREDNNSELFHCISLCSETTSET